VHIHYKGNPIRMNIRLAIATDIPAIARLMGQLGYSSDETYGQSPKGMRVFWLQALKNG
jgi:hypothetical protein